MRLLTFRKAGFATAGVVKDDGIVELGTRMGGAGVRAILAEDRLSEAEAIVAANPPDYPLAGIELDLPVPDPAKIFCVGVNYMNRNAEYRDGSTAPDYPSLFMRTPLSFVPHGGSVVVPPESDQLDYEGEIV
ncbi:MAG: fumarylacetoacetate hydrolase family protein, partial [Hyphomicrobiales bacterium]|nr:fumarylacetoacetate hydrolase family protein [Hyphomicrobiales bacterium]